MPEGVTLVLLAMAWLFSGAVIGLAVGRRRETKIGGRLALAEARTVAILDAAVDGIVTIDETGHILGFNRAAERIFGYQANEVEGLNVSMLMPEPYHSEHDGYLRNYLTTGRAKIIGKGREVMGKRKDGSTFPMDLAVGESRLGGRRIFAGIVRDITARRVVEERLRSSEERFRVLVDGVRDYAITMLDPEGRIVSWNEGAQRLYGWEAGEVVGATLSRFYPTEAVAAGEHLRSLDMAAKEGRYEEEGWRVSKDGSRFWARIVLTALRDDDGTLRGFARVSHDMTAQKAHSDALARARDEAERAKEIAEAAKEVSERARAEAERANLAKTKFLAAASHDLRQPVQGIFFFTSVLAQKLAGNPAARIVEDLESSIEGLNMLLDSLLDVSRLDAGLITPKETDFTIASVLERTFADFQHAAADKKLTLRMVPSSAIIHSDPALLSRILQNLVANAVRYTNSGRILLGCRRRGRALSIQVWDTGIGIPEEKTRDIFEEFTQLTNPERDRRQGLGLGLAIVDRLARLMGHRVEVRSAPGKGSMFSVEVPMAVRQLARGGMEAVRDSGRLVVLIDDEPMVLKGLSLLLRGWGFEVIAATSEEDAMRKLGHSIQRPSLILADYRLREGHTGTDAVAHIRNHFNTVIPSIIITGDTAPERLREAEASGLSILHKPVRPPTLRAAVEQFLDTGPASVQ